MLLIYGSIIILKIKLVIAFKIWIGNSIQSLNFGSLIQSCQIGVLVQSIHSCGTLKKVHYLFKNKNIIAGFYLQKNYCIYLTYLLYKICLQVINSNLKT